jgi:glyoxylate reductase
MSEREVAVTAELLGDVATRLHGLAAVRVRTSREQLDEDAMVAFIDRADAVITLVADPVTDLVLARCPRLRMVASCAVGVDNVDLDAARRRGVWVTHTPDVLTEATADLTLALILAVTRRVPEGMAMIEAGRFAGWQLNMLLGCGLQGKTLGIIGYGRIGRAVAARAGSFGVRIAVADPNVANDPSVEATSIDSLVETADILSFHCPLTDATHHLLDRGRLRRLKPGAYVVNTSRGPVIDEAALVEALEEGRCAGAALDVYEREPEVHPGLLGRPNVVLLPHLGSATVETRHAMASLAVDNVASLLRGEEPPTPVVRGEHLQRQGD